MLLSPWARAQGDFFLFLEFVMPDRRSMSDAGSQAYFSATASKTHYLNVKPRPQRGGIRL